MNGYYLPGMHNDFDPSASRYLDNTPVIYGNMDRMNTFELYPNQSSFMQQHGLPMGNIPGNQTPNQQMYPPMFNFPQG